LQKKIRGPKKGAVANFEVAFKSLGALAQHANAASEGGNWNTTNRNGRKDLLTFSF
jgi:hypothetical protein